MVGGRQARLNRSIDRLVFGNPRSARLGQGGEVKRPDRILRISIERISKRTQALEALRAMLDENPAGE
jgi:hypothetical protein